MRLDTAEIATIKTAVRRIDAHAQIFVFGSRADLTARGGDIDLAIVSPTIGVSEKLEILAEIKSVLGEQKIDILIVPAVDSKEPFYQSIRSAMKKI